MIAWVFNDECLHSSSARSTFYVSCSQLFIRKQAFSALLMPFLTKTDSNAVIKGSRDPLGVQALWTNFGRRIVGNLTTVSTSLRDFTATMLGYAFIEHMEGEANEVELFLRWEQWAAYCRVHRFGQVPVRGIERVNERLRTAKPITISASREHQILSNQKTYGLWGLYSMPSRASGLLEEKNSRLTNAAREFIGREYWPRVKALQTELKNTRSTLDLEGRHKRLAAAVAEVLAPPGPDNPLSQAEQVFYTDHLLHHSPTQRRAVASMPAELKRTFAPTPALLTAWAEHAARHDEELATMLDDVRAIEGLLAPASRLFSFLLGEHKEPLGTLAKNIGSTWGRAPFASLDLDRLENLRGLIQETTAGRVRSGEQWLSLAHALHAADYTQAIRLLCELNASVMQHRGGGPWITLEDEFLRVHADEKPVELPASTQLSTLWEHSYFLGPLAFMTSTLQA